MSDPGLYLTNATGETVPVHTEGHRDYQLLAEYLVENDLEDVVDETRVKKTGETAMTDGGAEMDRLPECEGCGSRSYSKGGTLGAYTCDDCGYTPKKHKREEISEVLTE